MESIKFVLGEEKLVKILVYSIRKQPFSVKEADFMLYGPSQDIVESFGECEIEKNEKGITITALISPMETGPYKLHIRYKIGHETLIKVIRIEVTKNG